MPIQENGYSSLLPPGTYLARAKKTGCGFSGSGTPFVGVLFELVGVNGEIEWKGWVSDGAIPYTLKNLVTLGYEGNDVDPLADDRPDLLPNQVELVTAHKEFNGRVYEEVKFINSPGGGKSKPGKLGLDLRAAFAAARKEAGARPANGKPAPAPEPVQVEDEQIPF